MLKNITKITHQWVVIIQAWEVLKPLAIFEWMILRIPPPKAQVKSPHEGHALIDDDHLLVMAPIENQLFWVTNDLNILVELLHVSLDNVRFVIASDVFPHDDIDFDALFGFAFEKFIQSISPGVVVGLSFFS